MAIVKFGWGRSIMRSPATEMVNTPSGNDVPYRAYSYPSGLENGVGLTFDEPLASGSVVMPAYSANDTSSSSCRIRLRSTDPIVEINGGTLYIGGSAIGSSIPGSFGTIRWGDGVITIMNANGVEYVREMSVPLTEFIAYSLNSSSNYKYIPWSIIVSDDPLQNWSGVRVVAGTLDLPPDTFDGFSGDPSSYRGSTPNTANPVYGSDAGSEIVHTVTTYRDIPEDSVIGGLQISGVLSQDSGATSSPTIHVNGADAEVSVAASPGHDIGSFGAQITGLNLPPTTPITAGLDLVAK